MSIDFRIFAKRLIRFLWDIYTKPQASKVIDMVLIILLHNVYIQNFHVIMKVIKTLSLTFIGFKYGAC